MSFVRPVAKYLPRMSRNIPFDKLEQIPISGPVVTQTLTQSQIVVCKA